MVGFSQDYLRQQGYEPYYLYRQKYMSGSFENVGWCKPGKACLYNIYMMEELHSIVALGAGATSKANLPGGRLERFANPKFPQQYLERLDHVIAEKQRLVHEAMHVLFGGYLGVTGTKISYISKDPPPQAPEKIMDATGMVLMPGLINCHTHLAMSLLRGCAEDCCLSRWLSDYVLPREDRLDARAARAGVMLSLAECLRFGVTSVSDLYSFPEVTAQAVAEVGIKANIAPALTLFADESEDFDFEKDPACHRLQELVEQWHGHDAGRIRIDAGIHAPYTSHYKRGTGVPGAVWLDVYPAAGLPPGV
ncbi:MAG: hypothetical protein BHW33_01160 [Firmicutes bacterium CAG:137_57_8]|nr:MAG: hypothetical protein BHW33_01160 [Firmicutes bacterium CAG:137_57_8]